MPIKNEENLTHLVTLYKDNSSCKLGLCIHFLNFTRKWLERKVRIERKIERRNLEEEEEDRARRAR